MPDLGSLLSQQSPGGAPQGAEPDDGRSSAGSLQALMAARGGGTPGQQPAPDYQQTVAALRHLYEFQKQFARILQTPNIGKIDIKGEVIDMFADVLADGYVTLPQVMEQMKSLPTNPLQQRQWVEQHYAQTRQAALAILQHHVQAFPQVPPGAGAMVEQQVRGRSGKSPQHIDMMAGVADHYRSRAGSRVA